MKKILHYFMIQIMKFLKIPTVEIQKRLCGVCNGNVIVPNVHGTPGTFLLCYHCSETGLEPMDTLSPPQNNTKIFVRIKNPPTRLVIPNGASSNSLIHMMAAHSSHRTIDHRFNSVTTWNFMSGLRPQKISGAVDDQFPTKTAQLKKAATIFEGD